MSEALVSLRGVLDRQKAVCAELLSLAEQQGDALISRHTGALEEIEARQSALLSQASRLDIRAHALLGELGVSLSVEGTPTVSAVAAKIGGPDASALQAIAEEIRAIVSRLARVIRVNAELFESAMDCVRFTVQLLACGCQPAPVCYPAMEAKRRGGSLMVDQCV